MTFLALCTASTIAAPGALTGLARRFRDTLPRPEARDEYFQAATRLQSGLAMVGEKGVAHELLLQMPHDDVPDSKSDASARGYLKGVETSHLHFIHEAPWSFKQAVEEVMRGMAQAGRWADRRLMVAFHGRALMDLGDHAGAAPVLRENLAQAERRRDALALAFARVYLARLLARVAPLDQLAEPEQLARAVIAANNPLMVGLAHHVLAQLAARRGELATAEVEVRTACERVQPFPTYSWDITALRVQILLSLGRAQEAFDAGEAALARLLGLGVSGFGEIDLRLAVAEARDAMNRTEDGRALLRDTLLSLCRRVDDIPSPEARARYLTEVPTHARLLSLARKWLGEQALREARLIVGVR